MADMREAWHIAMMRGEMPSGFSSSLQYVALNKRVPQRGRGKLPGKLHWQVALGRIKVSLPGQAKMLASAKTFANDCLGAKSGFRTLRFQAAQLS
jgi:hypothetical protein